MSHLALFSTLGRNAFAQLNFDWQIAPIHDTTHGVDELWKLNWLKQTAAYLSPTSNSCLRCTMNLVCVMTKQVKKKDFLRMNAPFAETITWRILQVTTEVYMIKYRKKEKKFSRYLIFELKNYSIVKIGVHKTIYWFKNTIKISPILSITAQFNLKPVTTAESLNGNNFNANDNFERRLAQLVWPKGTAVSVLHMFEKLWALFMHDECSVSFFDFFFKKQNYAYWEKFCWDSKFVSPPWIYFCNY